MHTSSEHKESWLDRWWTLLLILFGTAFALILGNWKPQS